MYIHIQPRSHNTIYAYTCTPHPGGRQVGGQAGVLLGVLAFCFCWLAFWRSGVLISGVLAFWSELAELSVLPDLGSSGYRIDKRH